VKEGMRKEKEGTIIGVSRSGMEDSRIHRAILDMNIHRETHDAQGGKKQGLAERITRR